MRITIVGTGNVATILGSMLRDAGHEIRAVVGRNPSTGSALAKELNTSFEILAESLAFKTELVLVAVSDKAIVAGLPRFDAGNAIWAHTSGAVPMQALKDYSPNYGVFYPLQSMHKHNKLSLEVPLLVDGVNDATRTALLNLAKTISPKVKIANDRERLDYHLAAVIVSNFTNHLFALAQDYAENRSLEFDYLLPLMEETVNRLKYYKARDLQTGPAIRKDLPTIQKHLELLANYPELQKLYSIMSDFIIGSNTSVEKDTG